MTPQEFGELIRVQRTAKGLDMKALASRFKLSVSMLRAIEDGRIGDLPHAVYARGFVRSYAQAVGLDPEDIQLGIESVFPTELFEDVPTVPGPISKPPRPRGRGGDKLIALLLALLIVGIPVAGGWFVITNYGDQIIAMVKKPLSAMSSSSSAAPAPVVQAPVKETPVAPVRPEPIASAAPDAAPQPGSAPRAGESPAESAAASSAPEQTPEAPVVQGNVAASEPAVSTPPVVDGKHVIIQAREECWVQATVDGASTRTFTVYPGETSLLPYKKKVTLVLGNSGGVNITHNGKPYTLSGRASEKRTLTFE